MVTPTILLISDTTAHPILFRHALGDLYHILPASASEFSISTVANMTLDLIIIDDAHLGKSIFDLIMELRRAPEFHNVPIIVISHSLKKSYLNRLMNAGANDFFEAPLEVEDIMDRLKDVNKYKEVQRKMGNLIGVVSSTTHQTSDLKTHFLLNRNAIDPIHESLQKGEPITLLIAEIDNEIEDATNATIADAIRNLLKPNELLIVLGRGKFIIFLLTPAKNGLLLAQKIQESCRAHHLTLSIGIASQKTPPYRNLTEMIGDARTALSRARDAGSQIILFHYTHLT